MGEMRVHGGQGDTRHTWNPENPDEVAAMRRMFDGLVKGKQFRAFRVNPQDASKGDPITEFDPSAGKVIIVAPMAGGQDAVQVVVTFDYQPDESDLEDETGMSEGEFNRLNDALAELGAENVQVKRGQGA